MFPYRFLMRFVLVLMMFSPVHGQTLDTSDFTFAHLGLKENISSRRVCSMCQTTDGAVWWTTNKGIDRYNGAVVAQYSVGDASIYSNFAGRTLKFAHGYEVAVAPEKLMAFDNGGRIYRYCPMQKRFNQIANIAELLKRDVVLNDVFTEENKLWLALSDGVYTFNLQSNTITTHLPKLFTNCILSMEKGQLLFCARQGVVANDKLRITSDKLRITNDKLQGANNNLAYNVLSGYYDAQSKLLWLGTSAEGVVVIDMKHGGSVTTIAGVPDNPVRSIVPYHGKMLIGVDGYGVYQTSAAERRATLLFDANDGDCGVLHGNGIYTVLTDRWDNILIGSYSGGVDIARPVGSTSAIFKHTRNDSQSLVNNHVNCVAQIGDNLLMGTDDGVSVHNVKVRNWKHVARGKVVLDICAKSGGGLLLATYGDGVCEVDVAGNTRRIYGTHNGTLPDDHVFSVGYDHDGNLWIGTLYGRLTVQTPGGLRYLNIDNVQTMTCLRDGRMAVGTSHGLYLVRATDTNVREVSYLLPNTTDANRFIQDLYESSDNRLWIATDGGGVYVYDLKRHTSRQITTRNGLPSNCVSSIARSGVGRIWFATDRGLAFIYPDKPEEVIDVNYCYGLQTEYVRGAVANLANGRMLYGTVEGAIIVNPEHVQRLNYSAKLNLTGVSVSKDENENVNENEDEDWGEDIYNMLHDGVLTLDYDQRSFELSFESINLRNQFDIAYQYRIGNNEWSDPFTQQSILFQNLEAGEHILYIRCISKTSGIVLDEKHIEVQICQPWWNSWWMWCVYVLLILLAFYGAWQIYQLHTRYMRLVYDKVIMPEEPLSTAVCNDAEEQPVAADDADSINDHEDAEVMDVHDADESEAATSFVNKATKVVMDNIMNTDFNIDFLSKEMGMSRTLFYVKLKTYTGKSPQDFVRIIRLERASSLLRQGRPVSEVSTLVGFENPKYFSTVFKKYFGVSPSKYR